MDRFSRERLSGEELRQIISSYLDEVARCYQEQQRTWPEAGQQNFSQLEQKADELLQAMMSSMEPSERRRAVLQVLSRAMEGRVPDFPS